MKTKIFTLVLMFSAVFSMAQTEENQLELRPAKGNFAFEFDFLPFSENGPIDLSMYKGRLFLSQNLALRLGLNIDQKKQNDEIPKLFSENENSLLKFDSYDMKYFVWGLQAGIEYHLLKNTAVSPYLGLDLGVEKKSSSYENVINQQNYNYPGYAYEEIKTEVENAWLSQNLTYNAYGEPYFYSSLSERAYTAFTANIVTGADIFLMKHFYAGVELGLGLHLVKYDEVTVKEDDVLTLKYKEIKDNTFGLNFNNAIRVGFWF